MNAVFHLIIHKKTVVFAKIKSGLNKITFKFEFAFTFKTKFQKFNLI